MKKPGHLGGDIPLSQIRMVKLQVQFESCILFYQRWFLDGSCGVLWALRIEDFADFECGRVKREVLLFQDEWGQVLFYDFF